MTDEELRSLAYAMDTMSHKERIEALKARDAAKEQSFTAPEVDRLVAQAEWQLLDDLEAAIPRKTERLAEFIADKRRTSDLGRRKGEGE